MHDTHRADKEIKHYEACLERLKPLWFDKRPGPYSDELTEAIEDIEKLAQTTVVFDIQVRLSALLYHLFDCDHDEMKAWRKAGMLLVNLQAMPSLRNLAHLCLMAGLGLVAVETTLIAA